MQDGARHKASPRRGLGAAGVKQRPESWDALHLGCARHRLLICFDSPYRALLVLVKNCATIERLNHGRAAQERL